MYVCVCTRACVCVLSFALIFKEEKKLVFNFRVKLSIQIFVIKVSLASVP